MAWQLTASPMTKLGSSWCTAIYSPNSFKAWSNESMTRSQE